jgi:hypothetical protein
VPRGCAGQSGQRSSPKLVFRAYTAPNQALEPTAYSFGFAYASGGGSAPVLGAHENQCSGGNRSSKLLHDFREMYPWQSVEGEGYSKDSCPVPKISALQKPWLVRKPSAFDSPGSAAVIISTSMLIPPNWSIYRTLTAKPSRIRSSNSCGSLSVIISTWRKSHEGLPYQRILQ